MFFKLFLHWVRRAASRACWPNKFDRLSQDSLRWFIDEAAKRAQDIHCLKGPDLLCAMCLGLFFGVGFLDDPLYPWAQSAMKIENAGDRRHALGQGVLSYFQSLKESRL